MVRELTQQEIADAIEHRDMLLALRAILSKKEGKDFIKYLFKSFDVGQPPPEGLEGSLLHDRLGFLRAGNSIFKIAAEADNEIAGLLLAQIEKERYDDLRKAHENEQGR